MQVIARFVYNPEKVERGLKAMADILADAIRRDQSRPATGGCTEGQEKGI